MEGLFPYGPVACMQWSGKGSVFGDKPGHSRRPRFWAGAIGVQWHQGTQRFWPAMDALASATRRSTYGLGPAARLCGCAAVNRAWTVVSKGRTSGSRGASLLGRRYAGAAHGSGSVDKLATLIPPCLNHQTYVFLRWGSCQGQFSHHRPVPCRLSLIRPSGTFSREKCGRRP